MTLTVGEVNETTCKTGQDIFLRNAPAFVFASRGKSNPFACLDCTVATACFNLAAVSTEPGCCRNGIRQMAAEAEYLCSDFVIC